MLDCALYDLMLFCAAEATSAAAAAAAAIPSVVCVKTVRAPFFTYLTPSPTTRNAFIYDIQRCISTINTSDISSAYRRNPNPDRRDDHARIIKKPSQCDECDDDLRRAGGVEQQKRWRSRRRGPCRTSCMIRGRVVLLSRLYPRLRMSAVKTLCLSVASCDSCERKERYGGGW